MHILIIEDDSRVAKFVTKGLQAEGHITDTAFDGESGCEMALGGQYDLIILDLNLPAKDGIQVCQEVRERGLQAPILMLTARDAVADKLRGFNAGADDYVTKPFAFEELVARVKALQRRGGTIEVVPAVQIADLTLDHDSHQVSRAGKPIKLTPTEFSLLDYFMANADRVLSRSMIEDRVWGYQQDPLTNVVDVYVRRLRKKIDHNHKPQLIHTIRGVGYQMQTPPGSTKSRLPSTDCINCEYLSSGRSTSN